MSQTTQSDFTQKVKDAVKFGTTFPVKKLGPHRLQRTMIPSSSRIVRNIHIDNEADVKMGVLALQMGLTVDELYRFITWTFLNDQE